MQIEQFQAVYHQKMRERNATKRLNAISDYLVNQHDLDISEELSKEQYLLQIIQLINDNPEEGDEILSDLILILSDTYSLGEPYVFAQVDTELNAAQLSESIREIFDDIKAFDSFDFELIDTPVYDDVKQSVEIKIRYTDWYINSFSQERERELSSGNLVLHFLINEKLCLMTKSGYNKLFSKLLGFMEENLSEFYTKNIYIQNRAKSLRSSEFAPLTLLACHLIYKKFTDIDFRVQNVASLTFNNEKAPYVKNAKLGGNNLFMDGDVIERIFRGDKITKFSVSLFKLNEITNTAIITNLTIDLKGILKITFDDTEFSDRVNLDIALHIYEAIDSLLLNTNTIAEAEDLIKANLKDVVTSGQLLTRFISTIKKDLVEILPGEDIIEKVNEYFSSKYDI